MCYLPHTNIIDLALLESWNLSACQGRSWFKLWLPRKAQNQRHRLYHKVRRGAENLYGEQLASLLGKLNQEVSILEARRVGNRCHIRNVEQVWWLPLYYDIPFSWPQSTSSQTSLSRLDAGLFLFGKLTCPGDKTSSYLGGTSQNGYVSTHALEVPVDF